MQIHQISDIHKMINFLEERKDWYFEKMRNISEEVGRAPSGIYLTDLRN